MTAPTDPESLAPFAPVALRLLNHVVASEEGPYWNLLLRHTDALRDYFARIGLTLILYEDDGFAYLTQLDQPDDDETLLPLPRITRRHHLTRAVTMVAIVLREQLDAWDEQHQAGRCQIAHADIWARCQLFLPQTTDERGHATGIDNALSRLVEWEWIVRRDVPGGTHFYEVRPLLRAMFGSDILAEVKEALAHDTTGI